jgi:hypothetical protein
MATTTKYTEAREMEELAKAPLTARALKYEMQGILRLIPLALSSELQL